MNPPPEHWFQADDATQGRQPALLRQLRPRARADRDHPRLHHPVQPISQIAHLYGRADDILVKVTHAKAARAKVRLCVHN